MSVTSFEDLSRTQQDRYNALVTQSARYVRSGAFDLEECTPSSLLDDDVELDEAFVDAFQSAVREELDRLTESPETRRREQQTQEVTTDASEIDWPRVWAECNIKPKKPLSMTQLALAIDVSEQTPITDEGAKSLIEDAVDIGGLRYFEDRARYAPTGGS